MKDSKFIELLNLYVDHQISPADAAWLENEIQQKPERRQIYRQYCQMQKACVLLAENFRTGAPAAAMAGGKVIEFNPRPRRVARAVYAFGALAAAACVALVVVNRRGVTATPAVSAQPATEVAAAMPSAPASVVAATRTPARPALQPAFAGLVRDSTSQDAMLSAAERANFEWMSRVQLDRPSTGQMWFDARPTIQTQDLMFRSRPSSQVQAENAAFRFQR